MKDFKYFLNGREIKPVNRSRLEYLLENDRELNDQDKDGLLYELAKVRFMENEEKSRKERNKEFKKSIAITVFAPTIVMLAIYFIGV